MKQSLIVLGLAAVLTLTGCAPAAKPGSGLTAQEPTLGSVTTIQTPSQVVLPTYAFLPSVAQSVAMMRESISLINQCVAASGGAGQANLVVTERDGVGLAVPEQASESDITWFVQSTRNADITRNGMWGYFDPESVSKYGYSIPSGSIGVALSTGADSAATNDCVARVSQVTPGGMVGAPFTESSLPDGGVPWQGNDSRFVAAVRSWSTCMANAGFHYSVPTDALGANFPAQPGAEATANAVAAADVQCKISTNLVGVGVAVQTAYEQAYIDLHRDALALLTKQVSDYIAGRVSVPVASAASSQSAPSAEHS